MLEGWENRIKASTTSQLYSALRTSINITNTELGTSCCTGERGGDAPTQSETGSLSWHGGHTRGAGCKALGAAEALEGWQPQGKCWMPPRPIRQMKEAALMKALWEHFHLPQKLRGGRIKHAWAACEPLSFPGLQKIHPLLGVWHKKPNSICLGGRLLPTPAAPRSKLRQNSSFHHLPRTCGP